MQVFRELYIRGEPEQLAATAKIICDSVSGDWSRDTEVEERVRRKTYTSEGPTYCFKRNQNGLRRAARLFLLQKDDTLLWVSNIVPEELGQLSYSEYNAIMEEFVELFVRSAADQTGAQIELTKADEDLEDWMSPETAKKLRQFCWLANKSTGSGHPADKERWHDFIVSVHREGRDLDSTTLRRWLHASGEWDEEFSHMLAREYEFARELLARADKQSVGV
jgi:hypothetical protein